MKTTLQTPRGRPDVPGVIDSKEYNSLHDLAPTTLSHAASATSLRRSHVLQHSNSERSILGVSSSQHHVNRCLSVQGVSPA